jgi:hypothetical protein
MSALQETTLSQATYISGPSSLVLTSILKTAINNYVYLVVCCRKYITYKYPIFIYPQAYYKNAVTNRVYTLSVGLWYFKPKIIHQQISLWYVNQKIHSPNNYSLVRQTNNTLNK